MTLKNQLTKFTHSRQDRMLEFFQQSHARVGLGHTGGHIKLNDWLDFQAGFAQAKDAVFSHFDSAEIKKICQSQNLDCLELHCQANDPTQFLLRPDLGKLLAAESHDLLEKLSIHTTYDLLIVISGGLAPIAIQQQLPHFLPKFLRTAQTHHWQIAPVIITPRSRVAFGDQVNHYFKAKLTIVLIGERPGLTTPDSLGIYVTYNAKPGCTDEQRNCISNIHAHGLSYADAATKLSILLSRALQAGVTGVMLKDGEQTNLA